MAQKKTKLQLQGKITFCIKITAFVVLEMQTLPTYRVQNIYFSSDKDGFKYGSSNDPVYMPPPTPSIKVSSNTCDLNTTRHKLSNSGLEVGIQAGQMLVTT